MRTIKFRAWNRRKKEIEFFELGDLYWRGVDTGDYGFPDETNVVMQYTGLKDKNGKEIYEGDIVRNIYPGGEKIYGVVGWPQCIDCKETYELAGSTYKKMMSFTDCEVIGNVYENPNLI